MSNSSRFFRKHAQIRDSFVVFLSHRLKILVQLRTHYARNVKRLNILVECKRAHYAGINEFHLSTGTFGFSNKFFKK